MDLRSADIFLPAVFLSYEAMAASPYMVTMALNVLSAYVADAIRGVFTHDTRVHCSAIVEKRPDGTEYREVDYDGPCEAFDQFAVVVKEVFDGS
jgi:hypothetical protein